MLDQASKDALSRGITGDEFAPAAFPRLVPVGRRCALGAEDSRARADRRAFAPGRPLVPATGAMTAAAMNGKINLSFH